MELRHLRYFVAVAEEQNITRAAGRLHVSQPGLSRQIRDLEDEIDVALFEHTPKSVRLTEAGHVFLVEARAALRRVEEAVLAAKAISSGENGELRVGYAPFLTIQIVPLALRYFSEAYPGVRVHLHDVSTQEMVTGLRDGVLDVALLVEASAKLMPKCAFVELRRYGVRVAVSPTHPIARKRRIALEQIVNERLIAFTRTEYPEYHEWLTELFRTLKQSLTIAEEHGSATSLMAAVEAGRGVALVLESFKSFVGPRVTLRPVAPTPPPLVVGAAYLRGAASAKVKAFISAAKRATQ